MRIPRLLLAALLSVVAMPVIAGPRVAMTTTLGEIVVELDAENATVTTVNFLGLVEGGRLDGATFYRVVTPENQPGDGVKIEVIQGGLGGNPAAEDTKPIEHETTKATGLRHLDGTISMARNAPGTASSEFFICVGDQPELDFGGKRNPDGQGFAAFGRVVEGMDVVRAIQKLPSEKQRLKEQVKITAIKRGD